jgi:hypothetical protein
MNLLDFSYLKYSQDITDKIIISINELICIAQKLNRCPSTSEYEALKQKAYCRRPLENRLKMKYNDICKKFIPQFTLNFIHEHSKEDILKALNKIKDEIGRAPSFREFKENLVLLLKL